MNNNMNMINNTIINKYYRTIKNTRPRAVGPDRKVARSEAKKSGKLDGGMLVGKK